MFPIWDPIFRTYRAEPRDGYENMRLDLHEVRGREAHRIFWLLGSVVKQDLGDLPLAIKKGVRDLTARDATLK